MLVCNRLRKCCAVVLCVKCGYSAEQASDPRDGWLWSVDVTCRITDRDHQSLRRGAVLGGVKFFGRCSVWLAVDVRYVIGTSSLEVPHRW